jgi:invasin B
MIMAGITGIDGMRANPKLFEAAQERVRKNGNIVEAAQQAASDLFALRLTKNADGNTGAVARNDLTQPQLAEPRRGAGLSSDATLTLLLGELLALFGEGMISQLQSRLDTFKNMMAAREASMDKLSAAAKKALAEEKAAVDALERATEELRQAKTAEDEARAGYEKAQEALAALDEESPGYQQAVAARDAAAAKLAAAEKAVQAAEAAAGKAVQVAEQKSKAANEQINQATKAGLGGDAARQMEENNLTSMARMTLLMATFIQLVGKNSETSLKNSLSLFQTMQEARQKSMEKSAKEFDDQVRKAEEAQRIGGCVGKIVGALITVAAVITTVASFGTATAAGVVLGAIGIAFMAADTVVGAVTGKSLTDRALEPLMEPLMKNVILPMMELLTKAIASVMTGLGVAKDIVDKVSSILAAVVTAVAIVAAMVLVAMVGKAAAGKMADLIGKLIGATIQKLAPQFIKQAAGKAGQALTRATTNVVKSFGLKTDSASVQVYSKNAGRVQNALVLTQGGTQAGTGIAHGVFQMNIAQAASELVFSESMMKQLSEYLRSAIDQFSSAQQMMQNMIASMTDVAADETTAGIAILANARRTGRA